MAVLGRLLVSGAERIDLADLLSIESYVAGDFKYLLKGLVGGSKPYILKGFDIIDPQNVVNQSDTCSIRVAESIVFFPNSDSGCFYHGLEEGNTNAQPLIPELRKNATNYVYLTFSTFSTATDTRAFWDPDFDGGNGGEYTQDVDTESVLRCEVNVSVGSFPANTIPIAKITVGANLIESIEDSRDLMFRLGNGGVSPDPYSSFAFRSLPSTGYERAEPPTKMETGGVNPFQGADKNIISLKEWMDVVMTKLKELGGTTYWYEDTSTYSLVNLFSDALGITFKSKGQWSHDSSTPGLITWSEDIHIKSVTDQRTYILRDGNKTLTDEQVAYLALNRNKKINATDEVVEWTNGSLFVNTVGGSVGRFANLNKGDWIKKINDGAHLFLRVEEFYVSPNGADGTTSNASAKSIRLSSAYQGTSGTERARYDQGEYDASDVVVSNKDQVAITSIGGDFHWLATRSDTIQKASTFTKTDLIGVSIEEHDGVVAKVDAGAAHSLVDGDLVTITGTTNFNGEYIVEVEDSNVFYISKTGGPFADETGDAHYVVVTTVARDNGYSFQLESAEHGFENLDTIIVAGTTNYNGSKKINVRSTTTFNMAASASAANESPANATATRANVIIRSEQGVGRIVQGESLAIDSGLSANIKSFIGMGSDSQSFPSYSVSPTYNTLNGQHSYNADVTDNLTQRVSKLTAMMADKAQDKTIKYHNQGCTSIINTANGLAQEITFLPGGSTLTILQPGSPGNAIVALPDTAPGISLLANQVAYVSIDRNAASAPTITVVNKVDLPIDENIIVLASRLNTSEVWLWDGMALSSGTTPIPTTGLAQDRNTKLVKGGTWSWNSGTSTLTWTSDAYIQVPGVSEVRNTVLAGNSTLLNADGRCIYVTINRTPGGATNLILAGADIASVPNDPSTLIIARRNGNDVLVGNGTIRLINGESQELESGLSDQNKTLIGSGVTEATSNPDYASRGAVNRITNNTEGVLEALARHDIEFDKALGQLRLIAKTAGDKKRVRITGAERTMFTGETITQEINGAMMSFSGAEIDFADGSIYGGDATQPLSTDFVTPLGVNFTPATVVANEYLWYSVAANASSTNPDGTVGITFNVTAAASSDTTPTLAEKPNLIGTKKIGFVAVKDDGTGGAGTILDFDAFALPSSSAQSKVSQLGVGSGSGGGGGAGGVVKAQLLDTINTTLPTGAVTVDGITVDPDDLVLFAALSSGNNKIYKAVGTIGNITSWSVQMIFNNVDTPVDGDIVYIQEGDMYADQLLGFDSIAWFNLLNHKVETLLNDNQVAPAVLFQVEHSEFKHIAMEFSMERGTNIKTSYVTMVCDGTSAAMTEAPSAELGSVGVTLSVDVSGSLFRVLYTSTNTGVQPTIKRTVRIW